MANCVSFTPVVRFTPSDMYFLNNRAYDEMLTTLFTATDDTIIDHFVLQNIDKTWLLHPSLTVQGHLDISNVLQLRQELFETKRQVTTLFHSLSIHH